MRIAVAGFIHETNTFVKKKTQYKDFEMSDSWPSISRGEKLISIFKYQNLAISGFLLESKKYNVEIIPILWCSASPSGYVEKLTFDKITNEIINTLKINFPLDGVFIDLHGAMVAEHIADADGNILEKIRLLIGSKIPLLASIDLHANVTPLMITSSDVLVSYRTYPHIDMAETGKRSFKYLHKLMLKKYRSNNIQVMKKTNFLIPLIHQSTLHDPLKTLYNDLVNHENTSKDIISVSITLGFPPSDTFYTGPSVIVSGYSQTAVNVTLTNLFKNLCSLEKKFVGKIFSIQNAIVEAKCILKNKTSDKPVILVDTEDNPGAGSASDDVSILNYMIKMNGYNSAIGVIFCPDTAKKAHEIGVGKSIEVNLGGRSNNNPWKAKVKVFALADGVITATGDMFKGNTFSMGLMAALSIDNVKIVVSSKRMQAAEKSIFRHVNIEPGDLDILVLKSTVHFRADFSDYQNVLIFESQGLNYTDHNKYNYKLIREGVRLMPMSDIVT